MSSKKVILSVICLVSVVLAIPDSLRAVALFQTAQTFRSGGVIALGIAVADMNGDGKSDLIVANQCVTSSSCHGGIAVLLGNGDGTFQPAKTFDSGPGSVNSIAVADINGDSKFDVVLSEGASCSPPCLASIHVMLGTGDGTLGSSHTYSTGAYEAVDVKLGDVNHDGKIDAVVANLCSDASQCASDTSPVSVLLGNGDGSFQAAKLVSSGDRQLMSLALTDVNGDGNIDILVQHYFGTVGILLGNGDGSFQTPELIQTGVTPLLSILSADVNGDGNPDMVVGGSFDFGQGPRASIGVLLGNGDGSFRPINNYGTVASYRSKVTAVTGDVNGDGKLDLIVALNCSSACSTSPVAVLLGNGDGTFQKAVIYYSGGKNAGAISIADFNGDTKPDLAIANACISNTDCTSGSAGVLLGISGVHTTTQFSSSLNPSVYGESVTFTASVSSIGRTPTGTVTFWNGSMGIGSATLVGGVGALTKSSLPAGSLSITAKYNGDANSAKGTSAPLSQIVIRASTHTTITSSLNPSNQGQSVTFTATVTCSTAHVTGTVTFTNGNQTLGTATLMSSGKARLTTSALPIGNYKIRATYHGTPNLSASGSYLAQTVN